MSVKRAEAETLTYGYIFRLWTPLAATWLMMSIEGPFLAAVIARLSEPTYNLAAYGVAFSFAIIVEAPVIMLLSATTALATNSTALSKLRRFTLILNLAVTAAMLILLMTPLYDWLTGQLMALPSEVSDRTRISLWILIPWPAAIGFRRFYQGVMIRTGRTRRVAYGTVVRVLAMSMCAIGLTKVVPGIQGAYVGAWALTVGVLFESVATRLMAIDDISSIMRIPATDSNEALSYRRIVDFYIPLALTSIIALTIHPTVTFFLGKSEMALESLAVLPVISALAFIFRSVSLAFQEVAIACLNGTRERLVKLTRFATALGFVATAGLMLVAFTPLATIWFRDVSGLAPELAEFSIFPLRLFSAIPLFSVLLAFQRAILMESRRTRPITIATIAEVAAIFAMLLVFVHEWRWIGVVAAVVSMLAGRFFGVVTLAFPVASRLWSYRDGPTARTVESLDSVNSSKATAREGSPQGSPDFLDGKPDRVPADREASCSRR